MSGPTPHYECAVSGELLPEGNLREVTVYEMETDGHDHFKRQKVETVMVSKEHFSSSITGVELYVVHGELVSVYRQEVTYGRAYPVSDNGVDVDTWQTVVEHVKGESDGSN